MTETTVAPAHRIRASPERATPAVSIVIPAYGRHGLTAHCIEAVLADPTDVSYELIVVDDGSEARFAADAAPGAPVSVVRRAEPGGFARACNEGAARAAADLLVFLNNDTLPRAGWLRALVDHAERNPEVAIVGAKLLYPDGTVQHAGVTFCQDRLPRHLYQGFSADHPAVNRPRSFKAVTAACMLVKREVFERAGGFDPAYRNCLEDVDLCLRVGDMGYRIDYCPAAELIHYESATRGRRSPDIDAAAKIFRKRWIDHIVPDDVGYYVDDRLLQIAYEDTFPVRMQLAPELAVLDGARAQRVDALLDVAMRRVFELLTETIRLTVNSVGLPGMSSPSAPAAPPELLERANMLEAEIAAIQQSLYEAGGREPSQQLAYRALRERVRDAVCSVTPRGSAVLVVSRGDSSFINLRDRSGYHFPQDPGGGYAGYHPAGDAEAVAHLQKLQAEGADYLVFPAPSSWWLKHYRGLATHLERTARLLVCNRDCQIYAL